MRFPQSRETGIPTGKRKDEGSGLFKSGSFRAGTVPRGILSGLLMTGTAVVIAGIAVAAATIPFILSLVWYIERKGVDGIVDAGFAFVRKRIAAEENVETREDHCRHL